MMITMLGGGEVEQKLPKARNSSKTSNLAILGADKVSFRVAGSKLSSARDCDLF